MTGEIPAERDRFVKQFAMSDGSYTAVTYSMPVHYKSNGTWKEIDTTLVRSGRKNYKTKATDLAIKISRKANKKSVVSMKRGKSGLSVALKGKKMKAAKAIEGQEWIVNYVSTRDGKVIGSEKCYKKTVELARKNGTELPDSHTDDTI